MTRPRRDRWLSIRDLGEYLARVFPRVGKMNGKRRREYASRLIKRVERRDEARYTKRVGSRLFVSLNALEAMLPANVETIGELESNVADLSQAHRALRRQVNGHGSKLREVEQRMSKLEKKQALTQEYLSKLAALEGEESRTNDAPGLQVAS